MSCVLPGARAMNNTKELVDRRKHKRFEVPIGAFIVLGPHSSKVGRIIDISMGGIAFRHVDKEEPSNRLNQVDLFHIDSDFCLKNLPCETVSELETYESPFGSFIIREYAVQFRDLTPHQLSQLEYFIRSHTIRGWSDR
jgi:hypothetical protein